jgi:hypothetical protein
MEIEPQSIVHQVIRFERTFARMLKRTVSSVSMTKRSKERRHSLATEESDDSNMSFCTSSFCVENSGISEGNSSGYEPTFHESSPEESPIFDKEEVKDLTVSIPEPQHGDYRTINQNEFFIECMINGEGATSVIHFFDKDSTQSMELDPLLERMAKKFTTCNFLRIDGAWTQFVSAKLRIDKFPTVLVIRNKVILDRLSDFEEMDYFSEEFLHEWLVRTFSN